MRTLISFLLTATFAFTLSAQTKGGLLGMQSDGDIVVLNTAKSMQVFHPMFLQIDLRSIGENFQIDLHAQYQKSFAAPAVVSPGAPAAIPYYTKDELFYYVTHFDPALVRNISIDQEGVLTYDVVAVSNEKQAVLEVVFVVKGDNYPKQGFLNAAQHKSLRFEREASLKFPQQCGYPKRAF